MPEGILLPHIPDQHDPSFVVHFAEFAEENEFNDTTPESISVLPASGPLRFGRLLIRMVAESVHIFYLLQRPEWTPSTQYVQTPYLPGRLGTGLTPCYIESAQFRVPENQPSFRLRPGELGRVMYNWRYSHGYWLYERWTFNILLSQGRVEPRVFVECSPSHALTRLSRLF